MLKQTRYIKLIADLEEEEMNKLAWASNMRKLERNNRVVLTNTDTGNWIKISKESFEIMDEAVSENINIEQIIGSFGVFQITSILVDRSRFV